MAYGLNAWQDSAQDSWPTTGPGYRLSAVKDTAQTVLVAETGSYKTGYYRVYPSYYSVTQPTNFIYGINIPNASSRFTERHFGGGNILWCDGHVKWMKFSEMIADSGFISTSKYWWGLDSSVPPRPNM